MIKHSGILSEYGSLKAIALAGFLLLFNYAFAQVDKQQPIIQLAKPQIHADQLENYKAALAEGIETSMRSEPGVMTLYAVSEKDNPTHITVFEIYANEKAYRAHLNAPHFKKYKSTTKEMIISLELIPTDPVILASKGK